MKTKSFWIPSVVFAAGLTLATRTESAPKAIGYFLIAETALFALAFLLATLLGGPDRILALGATLGFGVAVAAAILLGEDCNDELFCFGPTPGEAFMLGLLASLFLYPGWALGAIAGARTKMGRRRSW
jgi:hypothetical protein